MTEPATGGGAAVAPSDQVLAVLVCPVTRTPLRWDPHASELISDVAGLAYPVRDGIPVMIGEWARRLPRQAPEGN